MQLWSTGDKCIHKGGPGNCPLFYWFICFFLSLFVLLIDLSSYLFVCFFCIYSLFYTILCFSEPKFFIVMFDVYGKMNWLEICYQIKHLKNIEEFSGFSGQETRNSKEVNFSLETRRQMGGRRFKKQYILNTGQKNKDLQSKVFKMKLGLFLRRA